MSVYTKKGDKGTTKVFDKKTGELTSIRKDSCHIKTIGAVDELNAYLGIISSLSSNIKIINIIKVIQGNLFTINSILAGSKLNFTDKETRDLENDIDVWESKLPVQTNFIYYGGSEISSHLFYARALARCAERELTEFSKEVEIPEQIQKYINRLSDYLFVMARFINFKNKVKEKFWIT